MDDIPNNELVVYLGYGNGKNIINYPNLNFIAIDNCTII